MPAQRPRASFEPLPPDFDVKTLVEETPNFKYVDRISCETIKENGMESFERLINLHVVSAGKPLVIDGFDGFLDPWTFTPRWLIDNHGSKVENARNLTKKDNLPLTIGHYLNNLRPLAEQFFTSKNNYKDKERQRVYLKDIDCPPVWHDKVKEHIPLNLFYLNDNIGEIGGPGALDEPIPGGTGRRKGRGIARAGDLMSSLPLEMRAENLMCYIGHEGTYTPSHREMCASLGQNIMVEASGAVGDDGKPERPGSSVWFMTETKDRHTVAEYWLSKLGHDIEVESHFAQINAWKLAPFTTYVVEQRPGDFILIPPLAPHQVWNKGTRTMKVAWNRTTVETLRLALKEALPNARMVCRDEQYKNKAIVYYTLLKYSALLKSSKVQSQASQEVAEIIRYSRKTRELQKDFRHLFDLFKDIMLSELFATDAPREHPEFIPYDSNITCAYCRGNIFNRFLTCKSCPRALDAQVDEPYDICMECFAMGRSCACISGLIWVEQWKWKDLLHKYEDWRGQIIDICQGESEETPVPLPEERRFFGKKTLAQICQEQLKLRPWVDISNPKESEGSGDEEIQVNDDGTVKRTVKKRSKAWLNNNKTCHVCCKRHPKWKMTPCSNCDLWWCYGVLFRAFDLMPQTVMESPRWKCPHCDRVCNAGACRRDPRQKPYEPRGTLLGHDTKKVADARSVESLVDFSVSNLNWLREDVDTPRVNARLERRREEAERARNNDPILDGPVESVIDAPTRHKVIQFSPINAAPEAEADEDESMIDPALRTGLPRHESNGLPSVSEILDNTLPVEPASFTQNYSQLPYFDEDGDHEIESPHEFVAPRSVLYRQELGDDEDLGYRNNENTHDPRLDFHKRARGDEDEDEIKLISSKKRRKEDKVHQKAQNKTGATRQFEKEREKKKLDEAKKAGRFIQVFAKMKGKSKTVRLQISSDKLRQIRAQEVARRKSQAATNAAGPSNGAAAEQSVIIVSDIANNANKSLYKSAGAKPKASQTQYKVRTENDPDFKTRKDRRRSNATNGKGKKRERQYEDVSAGSDDEEFGSYGGNANNARRRSTWLAKKNQGDADLPSELPPNFKDGSVNRRERHNVPVASAQIRPSGRRPSGTNASEPTHIEILSDSGSGEETSSESYEDAHEQHEPGSPPFNEAAMKAARAAEGILAEENRKAKLLAAQWAAGDPEEFEEENRTPMAHNRGRVSPLRNTVKASTASSPAAKSMKSIFSKPGMRGRKIKIVSASSHRKIAPEPQKAQARRVSKFRDISDNTNSEDEIPASRDPPSARQSARVSFPVRPVRARGRPRKSL